MTFFKSIVPAIRVLGLIMAAGLFVGCEEKGPMEKAGESVDRGAEKVKDAVNPAGPGEKAGRAVDRAVDR